MLLSSVFIALLISFAPFFVLSQDPSPSPVACTDNDIVKIQLSWSKQSQFAGYYAALNNNYFEDECLVVIVEAGGPFVDVPEEVISRGAHFGSMWTSRFMWEVKSNNRTDLLQIAQITQKSGTRLVRLATNQEEINNTTKISWWPHLGHTQRVFLKNTYNLSHVNEVQQLESPFGLFDNSVSVISATTYGDMGQLLTLIKSNLGDGVSLYQPSDFDILNENTPGLLEDSIFVRKSWYDTEFGKRATKKFMRAVTKGWMLCREFPDQCVTSLEMADVAMSKWQLNEFNDLIWGAQQGLPFGTINETNLEKVYNSLELIGDVSGGFDSFKDNYNTTIMTNVRESFMQDTSFGHDWNGTNWVKKTLTWCYDVKAKTTVICEDIVISDSAADHTQLIIGLSVGLAGGCCILIVLIIFVLVLAIVFFKRKPNQMKVRAFKDLKSQTHKNSATAAEFKALLKNYDFISILTKCSANALEAKDIRRALVYFHVNNDTLFDMFDFFLEKEIEKHQQNFKIKKDTIVETTDCDDDGGNAERKPKRKSKKSDLKKKPVLKGSEAEDIDSILFRADSVVTDIFQYYSQLVGLSYLWFVLSFPVQKLEKLSRKQDKKLKKKGKVGEKTKMLPNMNVFGLTVDMAPNNSRTQDLSVNKLQLQILAQQIFVSVTRSVNFFPQPMRDLLKQVELRVTNVYGADSDILYESMSNFVFLRYICSALLCPNEYGILDSSPMADTTDILQGVSKVLQNLSSGYLFEQEEFLLDLNDFITTNLDTMKTFLCTILDPLPADPDQKMETKVPVNIENAGLTILYHYCSENRGLLSKIIAEVNDDTSWMFDEVFPEDSSDDSDIELV